MRMKMNTNWQKKCEKIVQEAKKNSEERMASNMKRNHKNYFNMLGNLLEK